jgi:hypothetical protein
VTQWSDWSVGKTEVRNVVVTKISSGLSIAAVFYRFASSGYLSVMK